MSPVSSLRGLEGCVWGLKSPWPGRHRLEGIADARPDEVVERLQLIPGVEYVQANPRKQTLAGWYIPTSLIVAGSRPARLRDYQLDPGTTTPSGLQLFEHQRRSVSFIRQVTPDMEGCILAGDPGVAKTITALQANHLDGLLQEPGIVVGSLPSRAAWCGSGADASRHYGMSIQPLDGEQLTPSDFEILRRHKHIFVHYAVLEAWQSALFSILKPHWLIFDESHALVHRASNRSRAARALSLCSSVQRRTLLTGTPIPNLRLDLCWQLVIAQPHQWGQTELPFGLRYSGARRETFEDGGGAIVYHEDETPEQHLVELRARLAGTFLRYTKADAPEGMPAIERHIISVELDPETRKRYMFACRDVTKFLRAEGKLGPEIREVTVGDTVVRLNPTDLAVEAAQLRLCNTLIGVLSEWKAVHAAALLTHLRQTHHHLVSFSWRVVGANVVHKSLLSQGGVFGPVDGTMSQEKRQELAGQFAAADHGVYVATFGSAGESINELNCGSVGVFSDLSYLPHPLIQAESRLQRVGNPNDTVHIYYIVGLNTIDQFLIHKLKQKAEAANSVSDEDVAGLHLVGDLTPDCYTKYGDRDVDALLDMLKLGAD